MIAAAYDNWIGLLVGISLIALLIVVLVVPERF